MFCKVTCSASNCVCKWEQVNFYYLVARCVSYWCGKARKTWVGALTAVIWPKLLKAALNSKQTKPCCSFNSTDKITPQIVPYWCRKLFNWDKTGKICMHILIIKPECFIIEHRHFFSSDTPANTSHKICLIQQIYIKILYTYLAGDSSTKYFFSLICLLLTLCIIGADCHQQLMN